VANNNNFVYKILARHVDIIDPTQIPLLDGPILDANTSVFDGISGRFTFLMHVVRRVVRFGT